mmetsp:Transcript_16559/g.52818  ORF Transcript_16559/g.52818 Transcript_16559/m.52818 type:complete len:346 (+) Transcript_16559:3587-4624(+)
MGSRRRSGPPAFASSTSRTRLPVPPGQLRVRRTVAHISVSFAGRHSWGTWRRLPCVSRRLNTAQKVRRRRTRAILRHRRIRRADSRSADAQAAVTQQRSSHALHGHTFSSSERRHALPSHEVRRQCRQHAQCSRIAALQCFGLQLERHDALPAGGQQRIPVRLAAHQQHAMRHIDGLQGEGQPRRHAVLGRRRIPHMQQRCQAVTSLRPAQHHLRLADQAPPRVCKLLQRSVHALPQRRGPDEGQRLPPQPLQRVAQHGACCRGRVHDHAKVRARIAAHREHRGERIRVLRAASVLSRAPQLESVQRERRAARLHLVQTVRPLRELLGVRGIVLEMREEGCVRAQ